jgi:hypothetical protein
MKIAYKRLLKVWCIPPKQEWPKKYFYYFYLFIYIIIIVIIIPTKSALKQSLFSSSGAELKQNLRPVE